MGYSGSWLLAGLLKSTLWFLELPDGHSLSGNHLQGWTTSWWLDLVDCRCAVLVNGDLSRNNIDTTQRASHFSYSRRRTRSRHNLLGFARDWIGLAWLHEQTQQTERSFGLGNVANHTHEIRPLLFWFDTPFILLRPKRIGVRPLVLSRKFIFWPNLNIERCFYCQSGLRK